MKAVVIHQHGDPSVLHYTEVPEPHVRANDVLVRVHACALNHLDLWVRRGIPGVPFPLPHILGSDVAGGGGQVGFGGETLEPWAEGGVGAWVTCGQERAGDSGNN